MSGPVVLIAGGGGFIGGHAVRYYLDQGWEVRSIDVKPLEEWHQLHTEAQNFRADLSLWPAAQQAVVDVDYVINLAADMGGIGYIENNKTRCMLSVLINTHLLEASLQAEVRRYFFASSACVYNAEKQTSPGATALVEADVYPAMPEDGYGWEKLFSERMSRHYREDFDLQTRVARFHNVYGPDGIFEGGREKAPAAICRKVAEAVISKNYEIDIWGDGEQTRSFMYVDDCTFGINLIANGDYVHPLNLGSNELVSINQLVTMVEDIAGVRLQRTYDLTAPQGVRGRNSDNTLIKDVYGWEPAMGLQEGLEKTYAWVYSQVAK